MLGEQFMVGDEICGAVVSIRPNVSPTHSYFNILIEHTGNEGFILCL